MVKWSNPGKGVAPSLGVVATEKGTFGSPPTTVALDYGRQLYNIL